MSHHQEVATLAHPRTGGIPSATFSTDGNTLATADKRSHSIRIWNLAGSGEKLVPSGHDGGRVLRGLQPGRQGPGIGEQGPIGEALGRRHRPAPAIPSLVLNRRSKAIAFSPDGRLLATGQFGPTSQPVQIWDLATLHACPPPDDELGRWAYGVAFSPDGEILAACGNGLTLWRVAEAEGGPGIAPRLSFKRMAHLPGQRSLSLCISSDSKLLAWADHDSSVCLWDLASGREIPFLGPTQSGGWGGLAFYPDSDHLTFGSARGMVETWDIRTMRRVSSWGKGDGIEVSPGGRWLLVPGRTLWSSQTGSRVFSLPQESGPIWSCDMSPDGERLAFGLADGRMAIWNRAQDPGSARRDRPGVAGGCPPEQAAGTPRVRARNAPRAEAPGKALLEPGKRLAWVGRLAEAEDAYRAALKLMPQRSRGA